MDELIFILISWDEQGVYGNEVSLKGSSRESQASEGEAAFVFFHFGQVSACELGSESSALQAAPLSRRKEQMSPECDPTSERAVLSPRRPGS